MHAPEAIRKVYILTFEYGGLIKVGGLGEAVRQYAAALARRGYSVTVLMPSHGRHLDPNRGFPLRPLDFAACGERRGLDGRIYPYCIGAEETEADGARIVMFKGLDTPTGLVFDKWYPYDNVEEKAALFARAVVAYAERYGLPDLVHANDWHSGLAGVALKDYAERSGVALPLVYTVHLSSGYAFPWHYASSDWASISDRPHLVWRVCCHKWERYSDVWNSVGGTAEAFAAVEADALSSVSWGYLNEFLSKYGEWMRGKSCVLYNATDWRLEEAEAHFARLAPDGSPWRLVEAVPHMEGRLDRDGSLFVAVGRATSQKGLDVAVKALDYAPSARLLVLAVSVGDRGYEDYLKELVRARPGRAAITFARVPKDLYMALIYASTALVMPSRWEPFGISAIEAMAVGTPVIATAVGGLPEVVRDFRAGEGTGLVVPPEDAYSVGLAMEYLARWLWRGNPNEVPDPAMRAAARRWPRYIPDLKRYISAYVDERFREKNLYEQLKDCYERARLMAYYRAITL
ncbi:glycogen/starch synthase [Thermoproteus tenax]|uniref:Glycogen synthase n=2 Tax=Thermoproteus tenax TaxID=2271 RepID=G4RKD7_THETK|nr:glycogen/starch synthase [Thermoproteus tenax]CCC82032.1 Glycogen synthase [Thermoproteus tenax Kra 1]